MGVAQFVLGRLFRSLRAPLLNGRLARSALDLNGSKTFQEIADESGLSLETVKKHLHSVFRKLEVNSRSRLMALMR